MNSKSATLWLLSAAALGCYLCEVISDPDIFFSLAVGRWEIVNGSLPRTDLWSAAMHGAAWLDPGALFNILVSMIETAFGWPGLAVLKLFLCTAVVGGLFLLFSAATADAFFAGIIGVLAACGMLERAPLNTELAGAVLFLGLLAAALRNEQLSPVAVIVCGLFSAAYSYVHPGWFLAILSLVALGRYRAAAVVACFGVLPPYWGGQLLQELKAGLAEAAFAIREQSAASTIFDYPFAFLMLLWVVAVLLSAGRREMPVPKREVVTAGLFSLIALALKGVVPYALVLTGFATCRLWETSPQTTPLASAVAGLRGFFIKLKFTGTAWVLLCIVIVNAVNFYRVPTDTGLLPVKEIDYIVGNNLSNPLWSESGIASYVAYRFSDADGNPKRKVAYGKRSLAEHPEWFAAELRGRASTLFGLAPATILVRVDSALYDSLIVDGRYTLAFENGEPAPRTDGKPAPRYAWAVFTRK